jgi:hypothetical protein
LFYRINGGYGSKIKRDDEVEDEGEGKVEFEDLSYE